MVRKGGGFWDLYANSYDAVRRLIPYNLMLDEVVMAIGLRPNISVLDVGCGSGNLSERLAQTRTRGLRIEAIDLSSEMLGAARQKFAGHADVKIYRADMNNCFFHADRSFDAAICVNALYAAKDPAFTIGELARVVRRGGRIVVVNPFAVCYAGLADIFREHYRVLFGGRSGLWSALKRTLSDLPHFAILAWRNCEIVRSARRGGFNFPTVREVERILRANGCRITMMRPTYAGTVALVVAEKVAVVSGTSEIVVKRVTAPAELDDVFRLRYDVYAEYLRSLPPENYPDKMERDAFDDRAIHFAAYDRGRICGALRLIPDGERGFLMEENFALPADLDRTKTVELSRLIGRTRHDKSVSDKLFAAAYCYSSEQGYRHWIGAWECNLKRFYAMRGWQFELLGEPVEYHNTRVVPVLLDLRTISM
ncbi:MAG: methyltransferase domain-containing protein [Candidatus Niyogibacteria bacterium]|nr:methyltransferase domain-containing protein [Candidatus Niyogibacteria bacterium]